MNAIIASFNVSQSAVVDPTHPPILGTLKVKAANGVLPEGLVLAKDSNGDVVAYDPAGTGPTASLAVIVGVLAHDCDTNKDDAAVVLKHGTASLSKLLVGVAEPDAAALSALQAFGIYAL